MMPGKTPTAKELHAAIEGLRKKAQQLRDELAQTEAKVAALERAASEHPGDAPAGSGGTPPGQK
jgi:hypothetical protein